MNCLAVFSQRIWVLLAVTVMLVKDSHQGKFERRLLNHLVNEDYNPYERPVVNDSEPLRVEFGITLQQILDVNERDQVLTSNAWLRFIWKDAYMTWDPADYGNVKDIRIPPDKIWVPDVLMYNSADDGFDGAYPSKVVISSDGSCLWVPPGIFRSTCTIEVANFPFDEQFCKMKFGSWTFHGFQLDLQKMWEEGDISNFMPNGEWDLIAVLANRSEFVYPCCPEPYPDITFTVHMKRRTLYYSFNMIIPCVLMSFLTMLTFTLPSESGEKLALGITLLLAETVFLLIISEKMPPASVVPIIGTYYAATIIMTGLSVVFTIFVLNLHHRHPDFYDMGRVCRFIFLKFLPTVLFMRKLDKHSDNMVQRGEKNEMVKVGTKLANAFNNYDQYHAMGRERAYSKELPEDFGNTTFQTTPENLVMLRETSAILEEVKYISSELRGQGEENASVVEWKYAANVIDRLCLVLFFIWTVANTLYILIAAPK